MCYKIQIHFIVADLLHTTAHIQVYITVLPKQTKLMLLNRFVLFKKNSIYKVAIFLEQPFKLCYKKMLVRY